MIEGRCQKCGKRYYGWALSQPRNHICNKCGVSLLISDQDKPSYEGYPPIYINKHNNFLVSSLDHVYQVVVSKDGGFQLLLINNFLKKSP